MNPSVPRSKNTPPSKIKKPTKLKIKNHVKKSPHIPRNPKNMPLFFKEKFKVKHKVINALKNEA